ncbi:MAG: NADH-quinone oxidoreductase subunit J [Acidimicrobiales bacterium]|nr:MAG: NADH-quinone oxidoreductase subunit J [Acidimicrobiales bacterium]
MSVVAELTNTVLAAAFKSSGNTGAMSTGEKVGFWCLAPVALGGAMGMVLARNAVHSALFLVSTMFSLGVFYVLQSGPFIGMVQIIVYTGAIMILFLFVLMLIGRDSEDSLIETLRGQRIAAVVLGIGLAGLVGSGLSRALGVVHARGLNAAAGQSDGHVPELAELLFTRYVFAFELTSALLIIAAVGAMVLGHSDSQSDVASQPEQSRARFRRGNYPAPVPGPGVYALADSVATPALLPDGSTTPASVVDTVERRRLDPNISDTKS